MRKARRMTKRSAGAPSGAGNGNARLTAAKVRAIRRKWASGRYTQVQLAEEYGVSRFQINRIVAKTSWAHIRD